MNKKEIINSKNNVDVKKIIDALEEIQKDDFIQKRMKDVFDFRPIIERLKDNTFKLVVAGEFSSGKSTFLNALIGRDLLKHGVKETTATITEIYNDHSMGDALQIETIFNDGTVSNDVHADEIGNITSTSSEAYKVADDISKVVIKCKILDDDSKICFVDTPGLNGVADKHREKTIEQIKNSHACIYLLQLRGIGESDIEFIRLICKYQRNIIFVQNFIEDIRKSEGETLSQKIEEQKKIIEQKIKNGNPEINYSIVGISSKKAMIARDPELSKKSEKKLTEEERDRLYEESHFDDVLDRINDLIKNNKKNNLQQYDTIRVALLLLQQICDLTQGIDKEEQEKWDKSVEGMELSNRKKILETIRSKHNEYRQKLENYIDSENDEIRRNCLSDMEENIKAIQEALSEKLKVIDTVDKMDCYFKNGLSNDLYQKITKIEDNLCHWLNVRYENLISNAVLRIRQYTGEQVKNSFGPFAVQEKTKDLIEFPEQEDEIDRLRKEIAQLKMQLKHDEENVKKKTNEKEKYETEIRKKEKRISEIIADKQEKIVSLGKMPDVKQGVEKEESYEQRGGLGILDALFGPKKIIRYINVYDDTDQKKWLKRKSDIETQYNTTVLDVDRLKRKLILERNSCEKELQHIQKMEEPRRRELQSMEDQLSSEIELLNVKKRKAAQDYIRVTKKSVFDSVCVYLTEQVEPILHDSFSESISESRENIKKIIMELFEISEKERERKLEISIIGIEEKYNNNELVEFLKKIKCAREIMEEYL